MLHRRRVCALPAEATVCLHFDEKGVDIQRVAVKA